MTDNIFTNHCIIFSKRGLLEFDPIDKQIKLIPVGKSNVTSKLRLFCEIEQSTTLGDIFEIVENYGLTQFISDYTSCDAKAFHQYKLDVGAEHINKLIIRSYFEHNAYDGRSWLESSINFMGTDGNKIDYPLDGISIGNLLAKEVLLDKESSLLIDATTKFKGTREYTLLEVLDVIYSELNIDASNAKKQFTGEIQDKLLDELKKQNPHPAT